MRRKPRSRMTEANRIAATTTDAPAMRLNQQGAEAPPTALVTFAEELGRLLARRLLNVPGRRRGYSLPEILLGASAMAVVWILIARTLGWLVR